MSLSDDVQFSMAEKKEKSTQSHGAEEDEDDDPEQVKTQELFKRLQSIVNKLTRQQFQELMKQVIDLTIDTEERLKGTVELIFEKAISEPNSSVVYANMCRCLVGLKVPTSKKQEVTLNFRKLLLNCCQKEFEKDQDDDEIFEKKQYEIWAAKKGEKRERLRVELQDSRDQAHRRSLGNIKFIGELFKLKMLTEAIMHDCVVKLLKKDNEDSLECVCMLLSTIGKDLDFEKAKPRMDQYFNQMDQIIKERKTSCRIHFMLEDVLDLRKSNWLQDEGQDDDPEQAKTQELFKTVKRVKELEKKSNAIIEEYLHINDLKETLQCVTELNSASLLYVFVRNGVESTLERSTVARERMGMLLHQLVKAEVLPTEQYYKGLEEALEAAEDTAIDIPHIWLYLAELIIPMLHEGGIPMGQLFREISKPLVPLGQAGVLLVQILKLLFKEMTPKKVGAMWTEGGLNWSDFLPEDEDVNKFVTEQKVEFTTGEETESKEVDEKKVLTGEELSKQLDRLIQDKANNQRIRDWAEANLDEQQTASDQFVRALMTSVCQSAIIGDSPYWVDARQISQRASLLQRYLSDEQKELQALYALQALMVHMEQPANLLRMFFDVLFDEEVFEVEAFLQWENSRDPAEQTGKEVASKSVIAFWDSLPWYYEIYGPPWE